MSKCVKTGCAVELAEYMASIRCDVFYVGNCVILNRGLDQMHPTRVRDENGKSYDWGVCGKPQARISRLDKGYVDDQCIVIPAKDISWSDEMMEHLQTLRDNYGVHVPVDS